MIGVFDSGFGGLTVLKDFFAEMPEYDYVYFGDNARAPYGGRSQETIYKYTKEAVDFLFAQGCTLIVLACNTASSQALRKIQIEYLPKKYPGRNVLGVIRPLVEVAALDPKVKRIGVIGTRATIESRAYEHELKKINPKLDIFSQSAPLLVPLIEEGWQNKPETKRILKKYLQPLKVKQIDSLILGCTHYPILYKDICKIMTKRCHVYNSGKIIASSLKEYIERHPEYSIQKNSNPKRIFFTSDSPERFKEMAKKFIGVDINEIKKINL